MDSNDVAVLVSAGAAVVSAFFAGLVFLSITKPANNTHWSSYKIIENLPTQITET